MPFSVEIDNLVVVGKRFVEFAQYPRSPTTVVPGPAFCGFNSMTLEQSAIASSSFPAAKYASARISMQLSVSEMSWAEFAFMRFSVSSKSGRARSSFPAA